MNQRTTNNIGGDGGEKSSVRVHHAPGGASTFSLVQRQDLFFRAIKVLSIKLQTKAGSTKTRVNSVWGQRNPQSKQTHPSV